jgi:hypothetical protein
MRSEGADLVASGATDPDPAGVCSSNTVVRRYAFAWWSRFNYILSAALSAGYALAIVRPTPSAVRATAADRPLDLPDRHLLYARLPEECVGQRCNRDSPCADARLFDVPRWNDRSQLNPVLDRQHNLQRHGRRARHAVQATRTGGEVWREFGQCCEQILCPSLAAPTDDHGHPHAPRHSGHNLSQLFACRSCFSHLFALVCTLYPLPL